MARIIVLLSVLIAGAAQATGQTFHLGERWSYRTYAGAEESSLLILGAREHPVHERVYVVRVNNLIHFDAPEAAATFVVSENALRDSVIERIEDSVDITPFLESVENIYDHLDNNRARIFDTSILDAFSVDI
ncbi:MAG: hypothetical protein V3U59_02975 [Gammaproteobacteria bacterium]